MNFQKFLDLKNQTKPIARSTQKQYRVLIKKTYQMLTECEKDKIDEGLEDLKWVEEHYEQIFEEMISGERKTITTVRKDCSLFKVLSQYGQYSNAFMFFSQKHTELEKITHTEALKQKRTEKQEAFKIDYNQYMAAVKKSYLDAFLTMQMTRRKKENNELESQLQRRKNYLLVQEAFILQFYADFPIRRDLGLCKLFREPVEAGSGLPTSDVVNSIFRDTEGNYFASLKCFKNAKKYGDVLFVLEDNLTVLLKWLMENAENASDSVLVNQYMKPMNRDKFGLVFKEIMLKYTGKESRVNDWRSCVPSHIFEGDNPLQLRIDLAKKMCHSVHTQMLHYQKMN